MTLKWQMAYACGHMGSSLLLNIVFQQLVFFYYPPEKSGLPLFISNTTGLKLITLVGLIAAAGRIWAAASDLMAAHVSDKRIFRSDSRITLMIISVLPAVIFCVLNFAPPVHGIHPMNLAWLISCQILFFSFMSFYQIPLFAMLPGLAQDEKSRRDLSMWTAIAYTAGIALAAQVPVLAGSFSSVYRLTKYQANISGISSLSFFGLIAMLIPIAAFSGVKEDHAGKHDIPFTTIIKTAFQNSHFRAYIVSDFAFYMAMTILTGGFMYYITVLLGLPESMMGPSIMIMVILSIVLSPVVNMIAGKYGKKKPIVCAMFFMAAVFIMIYGLGAYPINPSAQVFILVLLASIPVAIMGTLPTAILADIIMLDRMETGLSREAIFFASRSLIIKLGSMTGIFLLPAMLSLGHDTANSFGIRLTGLASCLLCVSAGFLFLRFDETALTLDPEKCKQCNDHISFVI